MDNPSSNSAKQGRPWLWIVAAFGVMMAFWATVVTIAFKNLPQNVPLAESSAASNADH